MFFQQSIPKFKRNMLIMILTCLISVTTLASLQPLTVHADGSMTEQLRATLLTGLAVVWA